MRRRCAVVVCAFVAGGCGYTQESLSEITGAPSAPAALETSCRAEVPAEFVVEPRNGNAYLSWAAVPQADEYEVEIFLLGSDVPAAGHRLTGTRWEWDAQGLGQGPYRARVRAVTACGTSDWSAEDVFLLNRSGRAVETSPAPVPPAPPHSPSSPPPPPAPASGAATPVVSCGSLSGTYAIDLRGTTFRGSASTSRAVAIPAGTYRVAVEAYDAGHRAGHQQGQTQETLVLSALYADGSTEQLGITQDIPDAATAVVSSFTVTVRTVSQVRLGSAGGDSVHGACVVWTGL